MNSNFETKIGEKKDFFTYLLTLTITGVSLVLSSGLTPILYSKMSAKPYSGIENLISFFGKNTFFLLQLLPFLVALLTLLLCVKLLHKQDIKTLFTQKIKFDFKRFFLSFIIWAFLLFGMFLVQLFVFKTSIKWNYVSEDFWILIIICLIFVTIQTLFEEILFRGYLLQALNDSFQKKWIGILFTALLFGAMHLNNPEIKIFGNSILLYYVLTGVFLALLTVLDKGIELSFGFHAVNNFFGTVILTNNWQVFQTDALFKDYSKPLISWEFWLTIFFLYPLLFFVYKKLYKWKIREIF